MDVSKELLKAREAKKKAIELYGDWKTVNGIGISSSKGKYSIKINLESAIEATKKIQPEIDGVPVVVKLVGKVSKQ
jgi:hypothetical protein